MRVNIENRFLVIKSGLKKSAGYIRFTLHKLPTFYVILAHEKCKRQNINKNKSFLNFTILINCDEQ